MKLILYRKCEICLENESQKAYHQLCTWPSNTDDAAKRRLRLSKDFPHLGLRLSSEVVPEASCELVNSRSRSEQRQQDRKKSHCGASCQIIIGRLLLPGELCACVEKGI